MPLSVMYAPSQGSPTTTFTIDVLSLSPGEIVSGDLLFLALASRDSSGAGTLAVTDGEIGAWAKIGNSTDHKATLWYRRATSSTEAATVTVANAVGSTCGVLIGVKGATPATTPYESITVESNASGNETHDTAAAASRYGACLFTMVVNYTDDINFSDMTMYDGGPGGPAPQGTLGATSTGGNDCSVMVASVLTSVSQLYLIPQQNVTWSQTNATTYSISWIVLAALNTVNPSTFDIELTANDINMVVPVQLPAATALMTVDFNDVSFVFDANIEVPSPRTAPSRVPDRVAKRIVRIS